MKRVSLDAGGWFDEDEAKKWDEATRWDGSNHISVPTGSQWEHEALYLTRKGGWVLNAWSQRQGSAESYVLIEPAEAARWLVRCCYELPEELEQFADAQEV